jgi:acyl-homoserine-lactone acylase
MAETKGSNPRGRRANELLSATAAMTLEDAVAIAVDTYVHGEAPWRAVLIAAYEETGDEWAHLAEAVKILLAWNGHADVDSVGMTLFRAWWMALQPRIDLVSKEAVQSGEALSEAARHALLAALDEATQQLIQQYGRLQVPWGEVYRARRGGESWPVGGVAGEAGLVTLRAVNGGEPVDGVSYIESGQSCTTVVMLKQGDVCSYSVVPYGQSEDPDSTHYTDQGRLLFCKGKLKDTWFARERLEEHVASRQVLTVKVAWH